jgi:hypothetical protein
MTAYGFSVIGDRLAQAALAAFIVGGMLLLAGIFLVIRPNRKRPASP